MREVSFVNEKRLSRDAGEALQRATLGFRFWTIIEA